jgi:predicted transcriptional regulator
MIQHWADALDVKSVPSKRLIIKTMDSELEAKNVRAALGRLKKEGLVREDSVLKLFFLTEKGAEALDAYKTLVSLRHIRYGG